MSEHHDSDLDRHVRGYLVVFLSLLALTVVTVAASLVHLPPVWTITVALLIATVKASLVACYFMHLISERKVIYAMLLFTVIFFLACLLLPLLTAADQVQV